MPKFTLESGFLSEYFKLNPQQKKLFRAAVRKIIAALESGNLPSPPLVQKMTDEEIYEVRWAGDGRATFHTRTDQSTGEIVVVWRHVGDHSVLNNP